MYQLWSLWCQVFAKSLFFKCSPGDSDSLGPMSEALPYLQVQNFTWLPGLSNVSSLTGFQNSISPSFSPKFLCEVLIWHHSHYKPGMLARAQGKILSAQVTSLFTSPCSFELWFLNNSFHSTGITSLQHILWPFKVIISIICMVLANA